MHNSRATPTPPPTPIRAVRVALGQLTMTSLGKQFTALQILTIMKIEKLGTDMCFTKSNQRPPRHCDKNESTEPTQEQLITATQQLLATSSRVHDVTVCKQLFIFWNHRERCRVKCWSTSVMLRAWNRSVHRANGVRYVWDVIQGVPGTSISEEIADVFCNYIIYRYSGKKFPDLD